MPADPRANLTEKPAALERRSRGTVLRRGALATATLLAMAIVFWWGVPCSFAELFHIPCPGCGTTRAARALLALDVRRAFAIHPIAPFTLAILALMAGRAALLFARDGHLRAFGRSRFDHLVARAFLVAVLASVAVWVVRFFGGLGGPVPV